MEPAGNRAELTRDLVYQPESAVLCADVGGEAVLLEMASGTYYSLNAVGSLIWQSLGSSASLGDIERLVAERFADSGSDLWPDLQAFVCSLESRGLVRRSVGDGSGPNG